MRVTCGPGSTASGDGGRVGRFVGIMRAVAPFLAGASNMQLRAFLTWSLLGTAVWSSTYVLTGYTFSTSFSTATGAFTYGALAIAVVAAAILLWRTRRASRITIAFAEPPEGA